MKNDTKSRANGRTGVKNGTRRIHFEFNSPNAEIVAIAGTFNDWKPDATPMVALGQGRWAKDLALPPGDYEYRLVVDGRWMADPAAAESVPNLFGGVNSICRVRNGD